MLGMLRALEEEMGTRALAVAWARQRGSREAGPAACAIPVINGVDLLTAYAAMVSGNEVFQLFRYGMDQAIKAINKQRVASISPAAAVPTEAAVLTFAVLSAREPTYRYANCLELDARVREILFAQKLESSEASGLFPAGGALSAETAVALIALLEYLCAEVLELELAGNKTNDDHNY